MHVQLTSALRQSALDSNALLCCQPKRVLLERLHAAVPMQLPINEKWMCTLLDCKSQALVSNPAAILCVRHCYSAITAILQ